MSEHLREEKQQRDKLQREKDELAASKYSMEQELKVRHLTPSLTTHQHGVKVKVTTNVEFHINWNRSEISKLRIKYR